MRKLSPTRKLSQLFLAYLPICLLTEIAICQDTIPRFEHLSVEQGLSQSTVYTIIQDRQGFIWIGTHDGLNKFNGYGFKVFHHDLFDSTSISHNTILALFEDKAGTLWIGTNGGGLNKLVYASQLEGQTWQADQTQRSSETFDRYLFNAQLVRNAIYSICEDHFGNLWVGSNDGLYKFDREKETFTGFLIDSASSIDNYIHRIYEDRTGVLWIARRGGGLYTFDYEQQKLMHFSDNSDVEPIWDRYTTTAFYEDVDGTLWIGTMGGGFLRYDREHKIFEEPGNISNTDGNRYIRALMGDEVGNLWIGLFGGGLELVLQISGEADLIQRFYHKPDNPGSLSHNIVNAVYRDRTGILWIGTQGGAINKFDPNRKKFSNYILSPNKSRTSSENGLWAIAEDRDGIIWLGSEAGGLTRFDPQNESFTQLALNKFSQARNNHIVRALVEDRFGKLWLGTSGGGLIEFDKVSNSFRRFQATPAHPDSLATTGIFHLFEDSRGDLWIGSNFGLHKLIRDATGRPLRFERYMHVPEDQASLSSPVVFTIVEDAHGAIWAGTDVGLNKLDAKSKKFKRYLHHAGSRNSRLSDNYIYSLYADSTGLLWIGTANGLNRLNVITDETAVFTTRYGLANNSIYKILPDGSGNLWLSTNSGLSRFNPRTGKCRNFSAADGLSSNEFNQGAGLKSRTGELYFGGVAGLTCFHPNRIDDNPYAPPIVLTEVKIFDRSIRLPQNGYASLVLPYDQNFIAFEFAALNYTGTEKNKYAYRLEGLDRDWVDNGTRRFASYPNLPPGEYTFRVKGSNNDGVWNETGAAFELAIRPPFWQTWGFRAFIAFTALAFVIAVFVVKTRGLKKRKRQLELLVSKRTAELQAQKERAENSERTIAQQAEQLKAIDKLKSRFFTNISHEFRTPLTLIIGPLEETIAAVKEKSLRERLDGVRQQAGGLLRLINQLLDLARIETGHLKLQPTPGDLEAFIRKIVLSFAPLAERKRVKIKCNFQNPDSSSPKKIIRFDHDKIETILHNLLSNAIKFSKPSGQVSLKAGLRISPPGEATVALVVRDNGIGIPENEIDRIFDRFYRIDYQPALSENASQNGNDLSSEAFLLEQQGTGIGLALTKELVELHNGTIRVASTTDQGATFTIELPLEIVATPEKIPHIDYPPDSEAHNGNRGNGSTMQAVNVSEERQRNPNSKHKKNGVHQARPIVLVVEDNEDVRAFIAETLAADFKVICAANGREGLAKARELIPDLVLSDVMMPDFDGYALCRKLKSDLGTSHIPVILLTAKASRDNRVEGLELGADDYVTKPFLPQELRARIINLIDQRRKLREKFSREFLLQPAEISITSLDANFLQDVMALAENNLADPDFNVENMASLLHVSRRQLHRKLLALTNQTPSEFLRTIRLQRAKQLLENRAGNVTEIAFRVGFNSSAYFSKCFREVFGHSPREISEELAKNGLTA